MKNASPSSTWPPSLEKASTNARRLHALDMPAPITSLLWRTNVLPQALYGCEVRHVRPSQLAPLSSLGKSLLSSKAPLRLSVWRSPEVLCGPPLGDTALRDPVFEMRLRQLQWLQLLVNLPGLVGCVHRTVAWKDDAWVEPTLALQSALQSISWTVHRNTSCLQASQWPTVSSEAPYPGEILLSPVDSFPLIGAVFSDGSLSAHGGAAAVQNDSDIALCAHLPVARSSTQCELVALCLALALYPPQVLTDSLSSLQLLRRWGQFSAARVLLCPDRVLIRQAIFLAAQRRPPPLLEKVAAHNAAGITLEHPKSLGNDAADCMAARAEADPGIEHWVLDRSFHGDPVELRDASGSWVVIVSATLQQQWWWQRVTSKLDGRQWLQQLYPDTVEISWSLPCGVFRRPVSNGGRFVHPVPSAVVKWLARVRVGSLATRARRHKRRLESSPACPCCSAPVEDDAHVVAGCPTTGSADWAQCITEAWVTASAATHLSPPQPAPSWVSSHYLQLMAALIPSSLLQECPLPLSDQARFFGRLHEALAVTTAGLLGRREALIQSAAALHPSATSSTAPVTAPLTPAYSLPVERQLSALELRTLEQARRQLTPINIAGAQASSSSSPPPSPSVPVSGPARQRWMQDRLVQLLREDTEPCAVRLGATSPMLVELFERVTQEPFTDTPGSLLTSRIKSLGRVLRDVLRDHGASFAPVLQSGKKGFYVTLNRFPKVPCVDIMTWRRRVETAEQYQAPPLRPRQITASQDPNLALWVRTHRYLLTEDVLTGEPGVALLLLWEVDHGRAWPTTARNRTGVLVGFTRRLAQQVAKDDELQGWFIPQELQRPLAPGLPDSHHLFWPVRVSQPPPSDPQGWYEDFVARWKAYLATLAVPLGVAAAPASAVSATPSSSTLAASPVPVVPAAGASGLQRARAATTPLPPTKRRRAIAPARPDAGDGDDQASRVRPRETSSVQEPPAKRRRDIRSFFQRPVPIGILGQAGIPAHGAPDHHHGRASQGPPT